MIVHACTVVPVAWLTSDVFLQQLVFLVTAQQAGYGKVPIDGNAR